MMRSLGIVVHWLTIVIVGQALLRILLAFWRLRHSNILSTPPLADDRVRGDAPRNWWSTASWCSEIPRPKSLISTALADPIVDVWLGGIIAGIWLLIQRCLLPPITVEQLTVGEGLGLQVRWLAGAEKKFVRFIPIEKIEEVAVVEAFQNMRVVTILAIVLKDEPEMIIPFKHTLPHEEDLYVIQDAVCELINLK